MSPCTKRRIHTLFLTITIVQIATTGFRQVFDFLGPLWALILTNFFNIVFCIFGFFGCYTRRNHFLFTYVVWSLWWSGWNAFILCLYLPVHNLEMYKSSVLSIGTGGYSWWELKAPGCEPDWALELRPTVTNCYLDPRILECVQAGLQAYLSLWGLLTAIFLMISPYSPPDDWDRKSSDGRSIRSGLDNYNTSKSRSLPAFLSLSRSTGSSSLNRMGRNSSRNSSRRNSSAPLKEYTNASYNVSSGDVTVNGTTEDRLRPMTPRKVKRRSARSIQSQRFGSRYNSHEVGSESGASSSRLRHSAGSSSKNNSLRSRNGRSSKRKNTTQQQQQFISPVNRLIMQQQMDSETSHDERYTTRDQGHFNPAFNGPMSSSAYSRQNSSHFQNPSQNHKNSQNSTQPPPPPRPPSARSSYSNYHPARLPMSSQPPAQNVFTNLNKNMLTNGNRNVFTNLNTFTNAGFDSSTEYNNSMLSNTTGYYEDEVVSYFPMMNITGPPPPAPLPTRPQLASPQIKNENIIHRGYGNINDQNLNHTQMGTNNNALVYPLAHSPISQESFPMWGVAQAQVPTQSPGARSSNSSYLPLSQNQNLNHLSPPFSSPPIGRIPQKQILQTSPHNSETVI